MVTVNSPATTKPKVALITGITGQDGSYLAEYLLEKGYIVHGIKRRASSFNTNRIDHLYKDRYDSSAKLFLHYGDLTDSAGLIRVVQNVRPDEIYNLGAMSHVHVSFETPEFTGNVDGLGAMRLLEAVRLLDMTKTTKIYQASSSELYGKVQQIPQNEKTPFYPRSPYAAAKIYAYWMTVNYREAYGMFASNGILFNHESPRRGETFVTRKITLGACRVALGQQKKLLLGNLNAKRDWGHAKDYVRAMYLMMQHSVPDDFVIATGRSTTVREFLKICFQMLGVEIEFTGQGELEKAVITKIDRSVFEEKVKHSSKHLNVGDIVVEVRSDYFRPTEVEELLGDASKAREQLKWSPEFTVEDIARDMISSDLVLAQKGHILIQHGHEVLYEYE